MHHMIPWVKPKLPLVLIALSLLSVPAHAATWAVDPATSTIDFAGENSGEKFAGKFETWTAAIDFDPSKPETSSVKVTIKTASAKTGAATYDATLPKKEWFDVETYPDAVFESKDIKSLGGDKYEAKGQLTIKNIPHDVTLPFTLIIKDKLATMTGDLKINRLDFDVGKKPDPDAEWVSKDIALSVRVTASEK